MPVTLNLPLLTLTQARAELLERRAGGDSLLLWGLAHRAYLKPGIKFDLRGHRYLIELYQTNARQTLIYKASQVGASELLLTVALNATIEQQHNVLYLFPTQGAISEFAAGRLEPAIDASPYLQANLHSGAGNARGVDRVTLKRFADAFLYLRGAQVKPDGNAPQLKSVDADRVIFDEVDEMDKRALPIAEKRVGHSADPRFYYASTPTYAGHGIHALWQTSDQREWFVTCGACGRRQVLTINHVVVEWDDLERPLMWHGKGEGRAFCACENCGQELDRTGPGTWVAAQPGADMVGFHITKLFSGMARLDEIVARLYTTDETQRKETINQDLGEPYAPRGGRISQAELDAARREYAPGPPTRGTAYAGIDVGPKVLHVVIRARVASGGLRLCYAGISVWSDLARLLDEYHVRVAVIDAQPEVTQAREFQAAWRGLCFLAYYPGQGFKDPAPVRVRREDGIVELDRTRTLDRVYAGLRAGELTLPANAAALPDYYAHLQAPVRRLEETKAAAVIRYVEDGPDHLAHAENYCLAAAGFAPPALPKKQPLKEAGWR